MAIKMELSDRRGTNLGLTRKPLLTRGALDQYRLVIACVRGNVSVRETISRLLNDVIGEVEQPPVLVLGPTAPEDLRSIPINARVGWVTFVDGNVQSQAQPGTAQLISPDNILEVNLFIEQAASVDSKQVIIGDFLDNIIKSSTSPESFYSFLCQLASRIRMKKRTAVLVIKEDIHDRSVVEMVKRFADIVLEFRDQEEEGGLTVEMRTLNFADNIYTKWVPFPEGLKPLSTNC
jgi:hypothetical protein